MKLLDLQDLVVEDANGFRLVDRVTLDIAQGEALGLVGESGSGKSLTALALLGLVRAPLAARAPRLAIAGQALHQADEATWQRLRGRSVALVFQDSATALNPVRTIGSLLVEAIRRHQRIGKRDARVRALDRLGEVGLQPVHADAYPHSLSGGMRQRAMLALALANRPRLLVADEPTTALDATIQLQILQLLKRQSRDRALLLITHDLAVAAELCDRIAVLYHARVREIGSAARLLSRPRHPYTRALLDLVPRAEFGAALPAPIPGAPPAPGERIEGCSFRPRCPRAIERCLQPPPLEGAHDHQVACWNPLDD
jgi:oligopeptide/dipeptide ABC transporter ATP-binding protein